MNIYNESGRRLLVSDIVKAINETGRLKLLIYLSHVKHLLN